uniref:Uncharacterized protein n=1 Tax=Amphimedon queenslandica TaxID=400682 RepID=A0A1X7U268_AMPQE
MSVRNQLKWAEVSKNPPYYLVYFKDERTVSVIKAASIVEDSSKLEPGSLCHVKERKVVYDGVVVTSGTKDDVVNVEEQFLNGVYNPDFIEVSSDSSDNDTDWDGLSCENINEKEGVSGGKQVDELAATSKRKRNDIYQGNQPKRPKGSNKGKQNDKKEETKKKEQQSKVTINAVSPLVVMSSVATASSSSLLPVVSNISEAPTSLEVATSSGMAAPLPLNEASLVPLNNSEGPLYSSSCNSSPGSPLLPSRISVHFRGYYQHTVNIHSYYLEVETPQSLHQASSTPLSSVLASSSSYNGTRILQESPLYLPHNNANKASISAISHLPPASLQPPVATIRSVVTESALEQEPVITQASIASHLGATMTSQPAPATPPSHPVAPVTPPILVTSPDPVAVITRAAGQQ